MFLDEKFAQNKSRYVAQCLLATFAIMVLLVFLDARNNAATVAALGSSAFIVFTMPNTDSARPRYILGGYLVAIVVGSLFHFLTTLEFIREILPGQESIYPLMAAMSVGLSIFIMVIINTEHPPAGGVALGLVLHDYNIKAVLVILIGVILLAILRKVLKPLLIDLL